MIRFCKHCHKAELGMRVRYTTRDGRVLDGWINGIGKNGARVEISTTDKQVPYVCIKDWATAKNVEVVNER